MDYNKEALRLHKEHGGKIEVVPKMPIENKDDLSCAYTPGVAAVCEEIHQNPDSVHELTIKKNTVAIVSDGTAVLGLGDIGPHAAMPVMEGKAALFKRFAGVDGFPLCLDTQDTEEIIATVKRVAPTFGAINLEDISAPRCFEIEERLRQELDIPIMHDDQHGTATVLLAGLINALKIRGGAKEDVRVVISGAGAAGVAIAKILLSYGITHITACDSKGVLCDERTDLNETKKRLADLTNPDNICGSLKDVLVGADVFIGVSAAGVLSQEMVRSMNERPIIFALANPQPEIMPHEAHEAGALVVATGRSDFPNQINNVLAFPGLFKGVLAARKQFSSEMFVVAAHAIANAVEDVTPEQIVPDPFDARVPDLVASAVK